MIAPSDGTPEFETSLGRLALWGGAGIMLFAGTIGVWAVGTTFSGAVVVSGQFVVDGNVKKVQHQAGGIVGELLVREGQQVSQDQILIRLDDTVTRANLQIVARQLDEFAARRGRLRAERDRKDNVGIALELGGRMSDPEVAELVAAEASLFEARRVAREGQKEQLRRRIGQSQDEIVGLKAQQASRDHQARLIEEELIGVRGLYKSNLVSISRKMTLEREVASLEGQRGQLIASVAQVEGKVAESRLQIIQVDDSLREEVMKELRELQGRTAELTERRVAAEDLLKRVDIRSPSAGFVHQLAVHTVGGVIMPAEPAMLIVPAEDRLQLEARINPPDIDQIAIGQSAKIKVQAFNQRVTPEIDGTVSRVSADTTRDQQTGLSFYTVRITLDPTGLARLAPRKVTAGMMADAFVQTEDRTPLQYLMKPLADQIAKAFRER